MDINILHIQLPIDDENDARCDAVATQFVETRRIRTYRLGERHDTLNTPHDDTIRTKINDILL